MIKSKLDPSSDQVLSKGIENPQLNDLKLLSSEKNVYLIKCINDEEIFKKSILFSKEEQINDLEQKRIFKQFVSNNEKIDFCKNKIVKQNHLNYSKDCHLNGLNKLTKISSKRKFSLPLPKPNNFSVQNIKNLSNEIDLVLLEELKINQITESLKSKYNIFSTYNDEKIFKSFQCRLDHNGEEARSCWVLLSLTGIYIIQKPCQTEKAFNKYLYEDIDLVVYDSSYHWFALVTRSSCQDEGQLYRINIGDSDITKSILGFIELYARRHLTSTRAETAKIQSISMRNYNQKKSYKFENSTSLCLLPSFCQSVIEMTAIEKWLFSLGRLKKDAGHQKDWLIMWQNRNCEEEEGFNSFDGSMNGHLMTRKNGFLSLWKPAYFILKDGYLYQYSDSADHLPSLTVNMKTCRGCMKMSKSSRPYSFEILRQSAPPILIAAPDNCTAHQWLEALQYVICNQVQKAEKRRLVSCQVLLTQHKLLLLQQNFDKLLMHVVRDRYMKPAATRLKHCCPNTAYSHDEKRTSRYLSTEVETARSQNTPLSQPCLNARLCLSTGIADGKKPEASSELATDSSPLNDHSMPSMFCVGQPDTGKPITTNPSLPVCLDPCRIASQNEIEQECRRQSQVISAGYLDQISCIFLIGEYSTSCLIEFECSEAVDMVDDWIVHFRTHKELSIFLDCLKQHNIQFEDIFKSMDIRRQNYFLKQSEMAQLTWNAS